MLLHLSRLICRFPRSVTLAAVLLIAVSAMYGRDAMQHLSLAPGWEVPGSGSALAQEMLRERLGKDDTPVLLLFRAKPDAAHPLPADVDAPPFRDAVEAVLARVGRLPEVGAVESYYGSAEGRMRSHDGTITYALVRLARGEDEGLGAFQRLRGVLHSDVLRVEVGGELAVYADMRASLEQDVWRAELLSFLLLAPLLVWVFGSLAAAALPLVIGASTVLVSTALLKWAGQYLEISAYAANVVSMLGLGLAIDYGLFVVSRFREELAKGSAEPVTTTLLTAGRTVLFSGLTVAASQLCLLLLPQRFFHDMGLAGSLAIGVAMLTSILLLPALLALLGPRVNRWTLPPLAARLERRHAGGRWIAFSQFVMRHARGVLAASLVLLVVLGLPVGHMALGPADSRALPADAESRRVQLTLEQAFPEVDFSPLVLTVTTRGDAHGEAGMAALYALDRQIQGLPGVTRVTGLASLDPSLTLEDYLLLYRHPEQFPMAGPALQAFARGPDTLMYVHYASPPSDPATRALVAQIRALPLPDGIEALQVGGWPAYHVDYIASLAEGVPWVALAIVAVIFVLLFLMLGSVVLPIKAILANLLSLSATLGGLVLIFQDGHLAGLLDFTPQGQLEGTVLVLICATAFGLSIDYEVFLLSRLKENCPGSGDRARAIAVGMQRSAPIITGAALLIGVVLLTFASVDVVFMKAMALGLLISVAVDVTLVRLLLVPALLRLLGPWIWWAPRPLVLLYEHCNPEERHKRRS